MATRRIASVQLFEFTDDEFLYLVADRGDEDGWVTTEELASSIGLQGEDRNRNVGSRLSWMRRFGCIERNTERGDPNMGAWRLTELGHDLISSPMKASQQKALEGMDDGQLWEATRLIGEMLPSVSDPGVQMLRRSWRVSLHRRRGL